MNKFLSVILIFFGVSFLLLAAIVGINLVADPMCYYRCPVVDIHRKTQNVYYQAAQTVRGNLDAEVIVLGSSRGETTSPLWIQKETGLKTINLSKGGSGLMLKLSLLQIVNEFNLPLKRVIWIADYFEFSEVSTDVKVRLTPALNKYLPGEKDKDFSISEVRTALQRLIDHNSLEASLKQLSSNESFDATSRGSASQINYDLCASVDFKGKTSLKVLQKEVDMSYASFLGPLTSALSENYVALFKKTVQSLSKQGVEVLVIIPPYHPKLMARFKEAHPMNYEVHMAWVRDLFALNDGEKVKVVSYYNGIPNDTGGPEYWDDGAHATCKTMMLILKPELDANQ
ncbi:hypothetical protein [Bdellovibrio bacteriovorus]|uniref:hypothetical protein n=1 Tax=Bdellovibrio bacteriovorus TaxID=959 RepID=UPI0035A72749